MFSQDDIYLAKLIKIKKLQVLGFNFFFATVISVQKISKIAKYLKVALICVCYLI